MIKELTQHERCCYFKHNDISLELFWDGKTNSNNCVISYCFKYKDEILMQSNDFRIGLGMYPDSVASVVNLLGFLLLQAGDTDKDFFNEHTPNHLLFVETNKAEELNMLVNDYENIAENEEQKEYHENAVKFFNEHTLINQ